MLNNITVFLTYMSQRDLNYRALESCSPTRINGLRLIAEEHEIYPADLEKVESRRYRA
jgi:hypothetical protein